MNIKIMKKKMLLIILLVFLVSCTVEENVSENEDKDEFRQYQKEFRLEIPTIAERKNLPSCEGLTFTKFPVDLDYVTSITPLFVFRNSSLFKFSFLKV